MTLIILLILLIILKILYNNKNITYKQNIKTDQKMFIQEMFNVAHEYVY